MLKLVVARYQGKVSHIHFRADAGFANSEVYEFLEGERIKYVIRLPANQVLQDRIVYLLERTVGRPPPTKCVGSVRVSPIRQEAGISRAE